jgi:hypothetical protein
MSIYHFEVLFSEQFYSFSHAFLYKHDLRFFIDLIVLNSWEVMKGYKRLYKTILAFTSNCKDIENVSFVGLRKEHFGIILRSLKMKS